VVRKFLQLALEKTISPSVKTQNPRAAYMLIASLSGQKSPMAFVAQEIAREWVKNWAQLAPLAGDYKKR
jgi:hypothetical protein